MSITGSEMSDGPINLLQNEGSVEPDGPDDAVDGPRRGFEPDGSSDRQATTAVLRDRGSRRSLQEIDGLVACIEQGIDQCRSIYVSTGQGGQIDNSSGQLIRNNTTVAAEVDVHTHADDGPKLLAARTGRRRSARNRFNQNAGEFALVVARSEDIVRPLERNNTVPHHSLDRSSHGDADCQGATEGPVRRRCRSTKT